MANASKPESALEDMALEIFELYLLIAVARSRRRSCDGDLSETEFLTLDLLSKEQPQTIGAVQKRIGVVPAQMSRIVRALEEQGGHGYVESKINPSDRRRIDISLTASGAGAHEKYRATRLSSMQQILEVLNPKDRTDFMRILRQIRDAFAAKMPTQQT